MRTEIKTGYKPPLRTGPSVGEQCMPKVNGVTFRCECGCNVFTKLEGDRYRCNACELEYQGA